MTLSPEADAAMSQYRNILVVTDASQRDVPALRTAAALARASGAALHLRAFCHHAGITALGLLNGEISELARKELLREQRAALEREADALRVGNLDVDVDVIWGHPLHDQVVGETLAVAPDLVVKEVRALPPVRRVLFTPLDWHLIRLCPVPLLLVQPDAQSLPRRVLAAVDTAFETPEAAGMNDDVLHAALDLALPCDAQIDVAHAFEGLPAAPRGPLEGAVNLPEAMYREFRAGRFAAFEAFTRRNSVPPERRHFVDGPPEFAIADLARTLRTDVIVMGSVARTALERILVGSTAERVLDAVGCDVLVLKPRGFRVALARHYGPLRSAA